MTERVPSFDLDGADLNGDGGRGTAAGRRRPWWSSGERREREESRGAGGEKGREAVGIPCVALTTREARHGGMGAAAWCQCRAALWRQEEEGEFAKNPFLFKSLIANWSSRLLGI